MGAKAGRTRFHVWMAALAMAAATAVLAVRGAIAVPNAESPVAVDDIVATPAGTPVDVDVLANDHDPDGEPITLTAVYPPGHGTATFTGGVVTYVPQAGFEGFDVFLYLIEDATGRTGTAAVHVYVGGEPLPPPPVLTVSPTFLTFGGVALNTTLDLDVTVTNETESTVSLADTVLIDQGDPRPFDGSSIAGESCRLPWHRDLEPGESCTLTVRFWAVPGAGGASPTRARLLDGASFETLATIPLMASVTDPNTGPNAPPVAIDDLTGVAPGFNHVLESTINDSDPDGDILRVVSVSDPPHGTASAPVRGLSNPNRDAVQYAPDLGYTGLDSFTYTVSDGRGGTASAVHHVVVGNIVPDITSVTPGSGPAGGGQAVRIAGANFVYGSSVRFVCPGGVFLPLEVVQLSDTEIRATTPPGAPGLCDLHVVTRFGQTGRLAGAYRYEEDPGPAASTTTVSATPNPAPVGALVTFTATVSAASSSGPTPQGSVQLDDTTTGASLGTAPLDAAGQARFETSALAVGTHAIAATYQPAPGSPYAASTGSVSVQVADPSIATTTTLTSSRNPSLTTAPPIFTAVVTPAVPGVRPTGAVEFLGLGTATAPVFERNGQFVALLTGAWLDPEGGPYTIQARYMGDATHATSVSAPLTQVVQEGTFYGEDVAGVSNGFAPVALDDTGRIAGTRRNGFVSRAAMYDPAVGFFVLDTASSFSEALDASASGTVVGRRGPSFAATSGFFFRSGLLGGVPGSISAAGINGREQAVVNLTSGLAAIYDGSTLPLAAFEAHSINDALVVVGDEVDGAGQRTPVVWDAGTLTTLGYPASSALRVNNTGGVLLQGTEPGQAARLYRPEIAAAYGLGPIRVWDLNDADSVVGGTEEASVWIGGTWTPLESGNVDGMAINDRGEIVGSVEGQLRRWTPVPTTRLFASPVTVVEGDDVTLTATLTSLGAPVAGQPVEFSLNDIVAGSANTGADGVARFSGPMVGVPVGVYLHGVRASFAGSRTFGSSFDTARLEVQAVEPADLTVTASTPTPSAPMGSTVALNVHVANLGPSSAPILRLNVTLPAGLQFVSDNAGGACSWVPGSGTCDFEPFAAGAARDITITAQTTTRAALTASFAVSGLHHDPNLTNNAATVTVDAPPTVTIDQAADQPDPAAVAPVRFSVVFSEPVTGFTGSDVSFAGSTVGGSLAASVTGSGANYTVAVTGMTGLGFVTVSIPAGAAVDGGGKPSAASTSTDRTVLYGISTFAGLVFPTNGGFALFSVVKTGDSLTGFVSYTRGNTTLFATRFTALVINGQTARLEGFSTTNRLFVVTGFDGGSGQPDRFRLWIEGVEQTPGTGAVTSTSTLVVQPWGPDARLKGWVDLHTHPMSNLAFAGKLFHGAPSVGSLMPAVQLPNDPGCRFDQRAVSRSEALSQDGPTRGDPLQSACGDVARNVVIKALEAFNGANTAPAGADGAPNFTYWPHWNDITHQKMWVDWIRRSWQYGQRVMIALSHNNRTLADLVTIGGAGPISGVKNDRASSVLQVDEIKRLVADNSDFMAIARTPDELRTIVEGGRLAVVLGVELDKLGDFGAGTTQSMVQAEIDQLYQQGVRYVLPIHVTDNVFGDTALYSDVYNIVNLRENGAWWSVGCAPIPDEVGFKVLGIPPVLAPLLPPGAPPLPSAPSCLFTVGNGVVFSGHVNARTPNGLTPLGDFAVDAFMKKGMIVDIDHMSDRAANRTLSRAAAVPGGGYPLMSGHSAVRSRSSASFGAENSRTTTQLARIACLGGMFGLGTGEKNGTRAVDWVAQYARGYDVMRRAFAPNGLCPQATPVGTSFLALGTDANSLVKTPRAPMLDPVGPPRFTPIYDPNNPANAGQTTLVRPPKGPGTVWDYNVDGVAHYGMFADFLRDVRTLPASATMSGAQIVDDQMMYGADHFYRMWLKADTQKTRVP